MAKDDRNKDAQDAQAQENKPAGESTQLSDEEARAVEAASLGFLSFCQTLPVEAVITPEGVYSSEVERRLEVARREQASVEGAQA